MEKKNKMGEVEEREEPNPRGERENGTHSSGNQELQEEPHFFGERGRRGSATEGVAGCGTSPFLMVCMFSIGQVIL